MKLKYYLRGVGTGILFATIILFISYSYKMSDGQIKKRAAELGMVMDTEEQSSSNLVNNSTDKSDATTENTSDDQTSDNEQTSDDDQTSGNEQTSGEEQTSEKASDEETSTDEPTTDTNADTNIEITCTITVTNKTRSQHVARKLEEAGIIEDADDFNDYLVDNGYDRKIQNGTFTFKKGMTYKEMAEYLTS